ncbi:MAG: NAD(+) synthase, partial [Victivallales bacterium]|nr:NAD(+) synthase [Victivallales bacterium]
FGFYRFAAVSPRLKVADVAFNTAEIISTAHECSKNETTAALYPEMALTAYSCRDLFLQPALRREALEGIKKIAAALAGSSMVIIVGAPFKWRNSLYNCAFVLQSGKIRGIIPKSYNPNYREFYDKRYFNSGRDVPAGTTVMNSVPFGTDLLFTCNGDLAFGVELCEDLWSVIPPSSEQAAAGASCIFNLSASNAMVAKSQYRRELVKQQSARCLAAYIYTSSGVHESSTDLVFDGHSIIAENGRIAAENKRFHRDSSTIYADIDLQKLQGIRLAESSISDMQTAKIFRNIDLIEVYAAPSIEYAEIDPAPFVPSDPARRDEHCEEIFNIQTAALAKRIEHVNAEKLIIGISGGLDSTLALLVCAETMKLLKRPLYDIMALTMPGFGTTDRTYRNAVELIKLIGAEFQEINITDACLLHFKDIGHDSAVHDITYENVQARERTQLLMDIANRENGLLIGTGDLSEIALGWSTYNGDHMSMYAVNCAVPKTLIRYLISWVADNSQQKLAAILEDIINTPVSPELLPNSRQNNINQKTEEIIGPYQLHDFFLYHLVKYGAEPEKIYHLATVAFEGVYEPEYILSILRLFIRRFFQQQFKRSCIPDGPKVGTICLSPRGDWRMPSDACTDTWLKRLDNILLQK